MHAHDPEVTPPDPGRMDHDAALRAATVLLTQHRERQSAALALKLGYPSAEPRQPRSFTAQELQKVLAIADEVMEEFTGALREILRGEEDVDLEKTVIASFALALTGDFALDVYAASTVTNLIVVEAAREGWLPKYKLGRLLDQDQETPESSLELARDALCTDMPVAPTPIRIGTRFEIFLGLLIERGATTLLIQAEPIEGRAETDDQPVWQERFTWWNFAGVSFAQVEHDRLLTEEGFQGQLACYRSGSREISQGELGDNSFSPHSLMGYVKKRFSPIRGTNPAEWDPVAHKTFDFYYGDRTYRFDCYMLRSNELSEPVLVRITSPAQAKDARAP